MDPETFGPVVGPSDALFVHWHPIRLSVLQVHAKAVAAYRRLFVAHACAPKGVAVVQGARAPGKIALDHADENHALARCVREEDPTHSPEFVICAGQFTAAMADNLDSFPSPFWPCWKTHNARLIQYHSSRGDDEMVVTVWARTPSWHQHPTLPDVGYFR